MEQAKFSDLRKTVLSSDDLEVRLWFLAAFSGIDGIAISRTDSQWTAIYLHGWANKGQQPKYYEEQMQPPRSGWESAWQKFVDSALLTMPDASQISCNVMGRDGMAFIVETNVNLTYRTYLYDNPTDAKCDEAKQLLNLISIVNEEFGTKWPTTK